MHAVGWHSLAFWPGWPLSAQGEVVYGLIPAEKVKTKVMGQIVNVPSAKTVAVAEVRNAAVAFGLLGVFLGGLVGASGGLARRSTFATSRCGGPRCDSGRGTGRSRLFRADTIFP